MQRAIWFVAFFIILAVGYYWLFIDQERVSEMSELAKNDEIISGDIKTVDIALATARELGICRTVPLNVSGAFHSPLMRSARKPLQEIINSVNFQDAKIPIYQNVVAKAVTNLKNIRQNILNQLENPVLWSDTIMKMVKNGMTEFIEVGPGKVLNGLNRRINKNIITHNFDKMENLDACAML